jgi:hypothetical protein
MPSELIFTYTANEENLTQFRLKLIYGTFSACRDRARDCDWEAIVGFGDGMKPTFLMLTTLG